jgi:hypothetical protein
MESKADRVLRRNSNSSHWEWKEEFGAVMVEKSEGETMPDDLP